MNVVAPSSTGEIRQGGETKKDRSSWTTHLSSQRRALGSNPINRRVETRGRDRSDRVHCLTSMTFTTSVDMRIAAVTTDWTTATGRSAICPVRRWGIRSRATKWTWWICWNSWPRPWAGKIQTYLNTRHVPPIESKTAATTGAAW